MNLSSEPCQAVASIAVGCHQHPQGYPVPSTQPESWCVVCLPSRQAGYWFALVGEGTEAPGVSLHSQELVPRI